MKMNHFVETEDDDEVVMIVAAVVFETEVNLDYSNCN